MPGPIATPGGQLSARALNQLNAMAHESANMQFGGGTQTANGWVPDQERGFFAEITAVGTGGWHSWERRVWQGFTATWITPPTPMKGNHATNGAYNLSGASLTVGDKVWLEPMGTRRASSVDWPVYQIVGGGGGSSGGWTPGTFCFLRYNGGGYTGTTSSDYTTCQFADNSGGSIAWTNVNVKNGTAGPLFHVATSRNTTSPGWTPASTYGPYTFTGIRATSSGNIEDYILPTMTFPAFFRYAPNDNVATRAPQFCFRGIGFPGSILSTWYYLTYDAHNAGQVARLKTRYSAVTSSTSVLGSPGPGSTSVIASLTLNAQTDMFADSFYPGINWQINPTLIGTVGYNPILGWFAESVAYAVDGQGRLLNWFGNAQSGQL